MCFALTTLVAITACAWVAGPGHAADSLPSQFDPGPDAPSLGAGDAPVVVVEFVDYRCEYCARQARTVFPEIRSRYIDTGHLRYAWVEALPSGDAEAERDALAARCANDAGRYMEARGYLFGETAFPREGSLDLGAFAGASGLDAGPLVLCVETGRHGPAVRNAVARAMAHRVTATPTYFFGYPVEGGTALTVERHVVGEIGAAEFGEIVDALIRSKREAEARRRVDR